MTKNTLSETYFTEGWRNVAPIKKSWSNRSKLTQYFYYYMNFNWATKSKQNVNQLLVWNILKWENTDKTVQFFIFFNRNWSKWNKIFSGLFSVKKKNPLLQPFESICNNWQLIWDLIITLKETLDTSIRKKGTV